ncbi:MAG: FemAB family XrtA/PEP-CTERM system-associated protein [Steroidobacteraceae bacterium]
MVRVEEATRAPADWDAFVQGHVLASAYHRAAAVEIGARAFKLRTYYLTARDADSRLVGVLPLVEQSSFVFGRFLVSVPFFTYGGVLANDEHTARALTSQAADLAQRRKVAHVELRHMQESELGLAQRTDKVSMMLELPPTMDELLKRLGSKLRSQIKKADKEVPEVQWGGAELVRDFYSVFAPSMHSLGTPVYPRRFFDAACTAFGELASILIVRVNGVVQAAALLVRHGHRIEVPWAAATEAGKRSSINMFMYREMLRYSIDRGATVFDFGRSTVDSGTYRFKAQWGAKPVQLYWHYWLPQGAEMPRLNNANPKYALAVQCWQRMPLWAANFLGPMISRSLP